MVQVLAYLREPERSGMHFERLETDHPGVRVHVASTLAEAAPALAQAEVLISIGGQLGADAGAIYAAMPQLRWAQSFGTGTDNMKDHPALAPDVTVTNVHGVHGAQMSEAALTAMLSFARLVPAFLRNQHERRWQRLMPTLLAGRTVGIFGLGAIAGALAPRCAALGMTVIGISSSARPVAGFAQVYARDQLEQAVAQVDYLVVLTPQTPQTYHILGEAVFAAMKPTSCLINLARGGVVDEAALLVALDADELAGAVLDVFETEPLPADHPFWAHPKVIVTPHNAGLHADYFGDAYAVISANLARYLAGGPAALAHKV